MVSQDNKQIEDEEVNKEKIIWLVYGIKSRMFNSIIWQALGWIFVMILKLSMSCF